MAVKISVTKLVVLATAIAVIHLATVNGQKGTCDNEARPANRKACAAQRFGELMPYPGDCSKFLVCNCENPTVKECPGGLWFDNVLKICNYPNNVDCKNNAGNEVTTPNYSERANDCIPPTGMTREICLNSLQGTILQYNFNCSAYINCTEGCPVLSYCQAGKVFNVLLQICDTPDTVQCQELPLSTSPATLSTPDMPSFTTAESLTTAQADICIIPAGIGENVCSDTLRNVYQYYPYNCMAYVQCQGDKPCLQYCQEGKVFNFKLGICDEDIECRETTDTTTPYPLRTTDVTTIGVSSSLPPFVDPALCQGKKDYTVLPYEQNCRNYLLCEGGEVKFERCPDGWFFNSKLMLCDQAADNQCLAEAATTTEFCLKQPPGSTLPHKENCQLYYYCLGNGLYYMIACPLGSFYDPKTGNCGPDVQALACLQTNLTTLTPAEKCANEILGTTFTYEENCSKYIFCKGNGEFLIMSCPYNNYYYPKTGNCGPNSDPNICRQGTQNTIEGSVTVTPAVTTVPTLNFKICNDSYRAQLISYPNNCGKYISCVRPIPIGFHCPTSFHFHEQQQTCVEDVKGSCSVVASNETTATNLPSDICRGHEVGTLQVNSDNCQLYYNCLAHDNYMLEACNQGEYFDPVQKLCSAHVASHSCWHYIESTVSSSKVTTPAPTQAKEICQNLPIGRKVNYPNNCSKYIVCEQAIPVAFQCTSGLQFSLEKQICVKPPDSDCGDLTASTAVANTKIPNTVKSRNQCSNKHDFSLLPYKNHCSMFIMCFGNISHLALCQTGEYFDMALEKCSAKANEYSCLTKTNTELPGANVPIINLTTCHNKPQGTRISYPNNCTKYIECQEPLNLGYDCAHGLEFSLQQQVCVLPHLADCSIKPPSSTTPKTNTTPTIQLPATAAWEACEYKPTGSTLPNADDCAKYYVCIKGQQKLANCMPKSYYNPFTGACDYNVTAYACLADTATTVAAPPSEISPNPCHNRQNGFMFANKQDCHQYFMCFAEFPVKCVCPYYKHYNPQAEKCEQATSNTTSCEEVNKKTITPEDNQITATVSTAANGKDATTAAVTNKPNETFKSA